CGELAIGSNIFGARDFSRDFGSAKNFATSALVLVTISRGGPGGGERPNQGVASWPRRAPLGTGGTPGARGEGLALASAKILIWPARNGGNARLTLTDIKLTCPAMTSVSAGAAPR